MNFCAKRLRTNADTARTLAADGERFRLAWMGDKNFIHIISSQWTLLGVHFRCELFNILEKRVSALGLPSIKFFLVRANGRKNFKYLIRLIEFPLEYRKPFFIWVLIKKMCSSGFSLFHSYCVWSAFAVFAWRTECHYNAHLISTISNTICTSLFHFMSSPFHYMPAECL